MVSAPPPTPLLWLVVQDKCNLDRACSHFREDNGMSSYELANVTVVSVHTGRGKRQNRQLGPIMGSLGTDGPIITGLQMCICETLQVWTEPGRPVQAEVRTAQTLRSAHGSSKAPFTPPLCLLSVCWGCDCFSCLFYTPWRLLWSVKSDELPPAMLVIQCWLCLKATKCLDKLIRLLKYKYNSLEVKEGWDYKKCFLDHFSNKTLLLVPSKIKYFQDKGEAGSWEKVLRWQGRRRNQQMIKNLGRRTQSGQAQGSRKISLRNH